MPGYGRSFNTPAALLASGLLLGLWAGQATAQTVADDVVCAGCVQGSDIENGTIGPSKLIPGSINATTIANGSIGPNKLIPGSINAATIATDAIRSNKILDGAVQGADLADDAVTGAKIANGAVSAAALAEDAVFGRILVVRNDPADQAGNCFELLATLSGITDNDADNRYTILLEPGIYDCGATPVSMKPYVDITGSGQNSTLIMGGRNNFLVGGADNAELRDLTVQNDAAVNVPVAIDTLTTSLRITNVTAISKNSALSAFAIRVRGTATLTNVTALADTAPDISIGILVNGGTSKLVNVTATGVNGAAGKNFGMQVQSNGIVVARNSVFVGADIAIVMALATVNIVSSQLDGAVTVSGTGTARCVGAYDGSFAPLDGACTAIP